MLVNHRLISFYPLSNGLIPVICMDFIRDTLDKYSAELKRVADCLVGFMAKNLGLHPEEFANLFNDGIQSVRINYYPPCRHANKVLGLSPHSDAVGLTLLLQVNQVEGLQIRRNGRWLPIKPLPGAFIVNIGDILEVTFILLQLEHYNLPSVVESTYY